MGKGGRQRESRYLASRGGSGGLVAGVQVQSTRRSGHWYLFCFILLPLHFFLGHLSLSFLVFFGS